MSRIVKAFPSPASEIKTLMRIGYDFNSAVADIIDNSLAAKANEISIEALPGQELPSISIVDNGSGMTKDELIENMRLSCKNADEAREDGDLGRFGSGLKTASFSQARMLTVITKSKSGEISGATWDIDLIEKNNSWDLQVLDETEVTNLIPDQLRLSETGTAIVWQNLQSFKETEHIISSDSLISNAIVELKGYVGLYFHRFMAGPNKVTLRINHEILNPINPFLEREKGYQEGREARLRCKGGSIIIKTHVLPSFSKMTKQAMESLGGASSILSSQGLYIYREKRLIVAGDWMGIRPHTNVDALARIQVDIPSTLDKDWSTDVKKQKLILPAKVKAELKKYLSDPVKRSRAVYTYKGKKEAQSPYWDIITDQNTGKTIYSINSDNKALVNIMEGMEVEEKKRLIRYLLELTSQVPVSHIYSTLSTKPKNLARGYDDIDIVIAKILEEEGKNVD